MKRQTIYILVGSPGSGKSWVANQVKDKFNHLGHDDNDGFEFSAYADKLARRAQEGDKPVLGETPSSLRGIMDPLVARGFEVKPIFIIESEETTRRRYEQRDRKPIPKGHITRIGTYRQRARELMAPSGTSDEILRYLLSLK